MANIYPFDSRNEGTLIDDKPPKKPYHSNGNEGGPPTMEERVSRLEVHMQYMRTDISKINGNIEGIHKTFSELKLWVIGSLITVILAFGGIVVAFGQYQSTWFQYGINQSKEEAKLFVEEMDKRHQQRMEDAKKFHQQSIESINIFYQQRMDDMEKRSDERWAAIQKTLDKIESKLSK